MKKLILALAILVGPGCAGWTPGDTATLVYQSCRAAPVITALVCSAIPPGADRDRCKKAHQIMSGILVSEVCK